MPKFSIIIPVYNGALYLRECLDSVLAQTFTDWEAICVDDGSIDGSGAILDEYAVRDSRFRVVHQANAGVSVARNVGLKKARGEWLLFADADDAFRAGAFLLIVKMVYCNDFDVYVFATPCEWNGERPLLATGGRVLRVVTCGKNGGKELLLKKGGIAGQSHTRCMKASLFRFVEYPPNVAMMEDSVFTIRSLSKESRWATTDLQVYLYRIRLGSASRIVPIGRPEEVIRTVKICMDEAESQLRLTRKELQQYACQLRGVLDRYILASFSTPQGRNLAEIVYEYFVLENKVGCSLVSYAVRLRCRIYRRFNRMVGFKIVRFIEYVFYGLKHRCAIWNFIHKRKGGEL